MAEVDNNFLTPRETFFGYLQELLNPEVQEEIWGTIILLLVSGRFWPDFSKEQWAMTSKKGTVDIST